MTKVGVFVDAGYLLAAGSILMFGEKVERARLVLDVPQVFDALLDVVVHRSDGNSLLRVYWYDGANPRYGKTSEHLLVANHNYFKLRLGLLNNEGKQKGVDSLIVSDLIELGRNKAIDDAVLVAGDEDVRIGVQIAQTFGVRVHLLGVHPKENQARTLREEADTITLWDAETVSKFLSRKSELDLAPEAVHMSVAQLDDRRTIIEAVVRNYIETQLTTEDRQLGREGSPDLVLAQHDRRVLPRCGAAVDGLLTEEERTFMRQQFRIAISEVPTETA